MFYGVMVGDSAVMITDAAHGKPVVELGEPECPSGYHVEVSWSDQGQYLVMSHELVPDEGTAEQAALALSRMQFNSLPDEAAVELRALAEPWAVGLSCVRGVRYLHAGELWSCLHDHVAQADWAPGAEPSLWAKVLPGQSGEVGEWVRPDSTNGYSTGDRVTHNGHLWESLVDDNVDEPGTDNGFRWKDLGEVSGEV